MILIDEVFIDKEERERESLTFTSILISLAIIGLDTMGVEGVFSFLKSEGIEFTEVDTRTFTDRIHVDVMALFRAYIISTETNIRTRIAKKEARTPGSTANETPHLYLASALDARLSKLFRKTRDILHFDGAPTLQKAHARNRRNAQHQAQLAKATNLIDQVVNLLPAPTIPAVALRMALLLLYLVPALEDKKLSNSQRRP